MIRKRGQLTIPDKVREIAGWLKENEVVGIEVGKEEIRVKPYSDLRSKGINWGELLRKITLSRSFKGKRGNLSGMIGEDRETH